MKTTQLSTGPSYGNGFDRLKGRAISGSYARWYVDTSRLRAPRTGRIA